MDGQIPFRITGLTFLGPVSIFTAAALALAIRSIRGKGNPV
jgi:hypothetical protein